MVRLADFSFRPRSQAPELAVQELTRCVKELGFPGVQIGSHIGPWNLDAPELLPFFEVSVACCARISLLSLSFCLFVCSICVCLLFARALISRTRV
eukprot:m.253361 g.253361  ORF g.253361 m.253361 type:complete len:96 (+) comp54532_c0_seq29:699-986(+)